MKNPRVLIVEDEMMVLLMIEDMMVDYGCESFASAATISQALEFIYEQSFDAVILDINLNGARSYEVAEALLTKQIPFVFCSGNSVRDLPKNLKNVPFLSKPVSYENLTEMLNKLVHNQ